MARIAAGIALAVASSALVPLLAEPWALSCAHAAETPAHGAIVVAVSSNATAPTRALAHEVYRHPDLRPAIDEPTARVLTGAPPDEDEKRKELSSIVGSIATSEQEPVARRLLASLGNELHAELVIAVTIQNERPLARVLRVATARYEGIELGATIQTNASGEKTYQWPGAAASLAPLLAQPQVGRQPARPLAAKPLPVSPKPKQEKSVWSSPWFWGSLGGVAAVGLTVFILSQTSQSPGTIYLDGRVSP